MVKNRYIKVKFQKEGVHKFPGADKDPKYATGKWDDVSFLGYPHRHVFHFYVTLGVTHNDRDVEFIQFKRELERLYNKNVLQLDYQSCEMIAEEGKRGVEVATSGKGIEEAGGFQKQAKKFQ